MSSIYKKYKMIFMNFIFPPTQFEVWFRKDRKHSFNRETEAQEPEKQKLYCDFYDSWLLFHQTSFLFFF